jgi:hypothetical protein
MGLLSIVGNRIKAAKKINPNKPVMIMEVSYPVDSNITSPLPNAANFSESRQVTFSVFHSLLFHLQ